MARKSNFKSKINWMAALSTLGAALVDPQLGALLPPDVAAVWLPKIVYATSVLTMVFRSAFTDVR